MLFKYSNKQECFVIKDNDNIRPFNTSENMIRHRKFVNEDGSIKSNYANELSQDLIDDVFYHSTHTQLFISAPPNYDTVYRDDILSFVTDNLSKISSAQLGLFDTEKFLIDKRLLLVYFQFSYDLIEKIYQEEFCKYSLDTLFEYRCIRQYNSEKYKKMNNKSNLSELVKEAACNYSPANDDALKQFKNYELKKLKGILSIFTDVDLQQSKNNLSPLDYCLFNYILESCDEEDKKGQDKKDNSNNTNPRFGRKLRKGKFYEINNYYYDILYCGIIMFVKHHYKDIDITPIKRKFSTIASYSLNEFNYSIDNISAMLNALIEDMKEHRSLPDKKRIKKLMKKSKKIEKELYEIIHKKYE